MPCFICGSLPSSQASACDHCSNQLTWRANHCARCHRGITGPLTPCCGHCLNTPPPWRALYAPFHYTGVIKHAISQFKYHQQHWLGNWLAELLYQHLIRQKHTTWPKALVPVPIHHQRLRQRGFNQTLLIAKTLSSRLGIPVHQHGCIRTTATLPQHSMRKTQRYYNLKQAFQVTQPCPAHIAIIDDICTTGSTLTVLAQHLSQHGACNIEAWCIATSTH